MTTPGDRAGIEPIIGLLQEQPAKIGTIQEGNVLQEKRRFTGGRIATLNPIYATPSIAKKLHGIVCHQKEHSFNQMELA